MSNQAGLDGRTVLVTGGGAGIGAETARRFTAAGAQVVIFERDAEHVAAISEELPKARVLALDVADAAAVDDAFLDLDRDGLHVDVLVNNVAACSSDSLLTIGPDLIERDLRITLAVPMLMSQRVLRGMVPRRSGVILNVASVNGLGFYGNESYSAAKAGLINFTKSVAVEFGQYGIRCNAVAPGTVATGAWQRRLDRDPDVLATASRWYPLGRVGEPADIANALVFLASDAASWISGVCLPVDGGLTAGNFHMTHDIVVDQPR